MWRRGGCEEGEAGSGLAEFALASLLIFTLVFGIIELGRCFYSYCWVSSAARLGTRYAMVRGTCTLANGDACPNCSGDTLPCQATDTAGGGNNGGDSGDIPTYIQNYAIGIGWSNVTVIAKCYTPGVVAPPSPPCMPGTWVQVNVQYTFNFITPLISRLVPAGGWTMTGTSQRVVLQNQ